MLLAKTVRSSTFKLALICIVIFGAAVLALFSYVGWATASYIRGRSDQAIAAENAFLLQAFADSGPSGLIAAMARRIADRGLEGGVYLLVDASNATLAGNLRAWPSDLIGREGWATVDAPEGNPNVESRSLVRASFETLSDGSHLLVGRDVGDLNGFVRHIIAALAMTILLILVLAGAASISVTRRTVGRIEAINAASRAIMRSGLGQRIPLRGTRDEWDELASNLNTMLGRIETLVGEIRQFTDNVAHDLRTPLTRMRARLEKACGGQRDSRIDQSLIGDTLADLDAVLSMFTSLTRISQIEASDRTAAFRRVDLTEIAREVIELFDAAAEDKGGNLKWLADGPVIVTGDRDLLFDAVANLVDNALKHGREGGRVTVAVSYGDHGAVISIADDGPGIPAAEHDRVFNRFYRLSRSRQVPGNGLGLSLVAAVARLHGAQIEMLDNAPGLKFQLRFPYGGQQGTMVQYSIAAKTREVAVEPACP